ncbi:MAG: hypothetical protein IJE96_00195 [Mailhella sp.]|nr:hypothetical protein [Mailhella sp.]
MAEAGSYHLFQGFRRRERRPFLPTGKEGGSGPFRIVRFFRKALHESTLYAPHSKNWKCRSLYQTGRSDWDILLKYMEKCICLKKDGPGLAHNAGHKNFYQKMLVQTSLFYVIPLRVTSSFSYSFLPFFFPVHEEDIHQRKVLFCRVPSWHSGVFSAAVDGVGMGCLA